MIFHYPFKTSEKSLYEAVEVVITKFLAKSRQRRERTFNTSLILFSNEMSETKQEFRLFEFWDKNAEKFSIPSPEGNNGSHYDDTQIQRIGISVVIMPLPKKITVENPKINYGLMVKKWISVCQRCW
jgi:hypothetical protein